MLWGIAFLVLLESSAPIAAEQIYPTSLIPPAVWDSARSMTVVNRDPLSPDMSELLARLIVVSRGEDLSDEALRRTIERCAKPGKGFGLFEKDGTKQLFSCYLLGSLDLQMKVRRQEELIEFQGREIARLSAETLLLKAAIAKLAEGAK